MGAEPRDFVPLKVIAGFAVQPFVAAALGYLSAPLIEWHSRLVSGAVADDMRQVAISLAGGAAIAAVALELVVALPIFLWLTDRGPLRFKQVLVCGVAIPGIPVLLLGIAGVVQGGQGIAAVIRTILIASIFGLTLACVFWVVSIRGTRLAGNDQRLMP